MQITFCLYYKHVLYNNILFIRSDVSLLSTKVTIIWPGMKFMATTEHYSLDSCVSLVLGFKSLPLLKKIRLEMFP